MGKKHERRIGSGSPQQTRRSTAPTDEQKVTVSTPEVLHDRAENARFSAVILTEREEPYPQAATGEDSLKLEPNNSAESGCCKSDSPKKWGYKNLFGLCVSYLIIFSVFQALQNLQSSINSTEGLGLASLAILYSCFFVAGFVTPAIVKLLGTKYSLLLGFICHLVYTLTNYYPSWYTLIPSSILVGLASAPIWAAAHTHITKVAVEIAPALRKDLALVISRFTGIFFFFFQISQLPGNLASSLILFPYSNDDTLSNTSIVVASPGLQICNYLNETTPIETKYLYALVSVYAVFIVVGIVILFFAVDRLPSDNQLLSKEKKFHLYLRKPFIELLQVLKDWRMIMITPMPIFVGMELAFVFGSFTEVYISECFGTYQVGFTLIAFGLSSAVVSIAYGRVVKFIPRFAIVLLGASINVALLVFLFVWERVPSYAVIFTFAIGWGAADAVWQNVMCSLTGILFVDKLETAYSAIRIWQALGFTVGFVAAELLPLEGLLSLLLVTVAFATLFNFVVEVRTQSKEQLLPCVYRSTKSDKSDSKTQRTLQCNENRIPSHTNALFVYCGRKPSMFSNEGTPESRRGSTIPGPKNVTALAVVLEDANESDHNLHKSELPQKTYSVHRSPSYLVALNSSEMKYSIHRSPSYLVALNSSSDILEDHTRTESLS